MLELVLVLVILAIISGAVMPALISFAAGRRGGNAAMTVVAMANEARGRAVAEGATYRMNFDPGAGQLWLTVQREGVFVPADGEFGQRQSLPEGVRLTVDVTPAAVAVPIVSPDVTQSSDPTPTAPYGQDLATPNSLVRVPHDGGAGLYVQVTPGGRTDPCRIQLTDDRGATLNLGCSSATDVLHVLKPGEL